LSTNSLYQYLEDLTDATKTTVKYYSTIYKTKQSYHYIVTHAQTSIHLTHSLYMYAHATRSSNSELLWCLLCNSQTINANRMEKAHIQLMASRSRDLYIDILNLIYCSIYQYIGCTKRTFQVQNAHLLHYPQHTTAQEM